MVTTCASVATWWPNLIPMLVCWRHLAVVYIEINIKFSKKKPWTIRPIVPLAMKTSAILEVKIIYLPSSIYKCDESTNEDDRSYPPNKWQIGTRKQLFDSSFFHLLASYFATATLRASSSTHTLHLKLYFHRDDSDKSKRDSIVQYPITKREASLSSETRSTRWVKGVGRLWGREAVKLGATLTPRRRLLSDQQCSVQLLRSCLLYDFQNRVQYSILCNAQQTRPLVVDVQHCEQTWSIFTHN